MFPSYDVEHFSIIFVARNYQWWRDERTLCIRKPHIWKFCTFFRTVVWIIMNKWLVILLVLRWSMSDSEDKPLSRFVFWWLKLVCLGFNHWNFVVMVIFGDWWLIWSGCINIYFFKDVHLVFNVVQFVCFVNLCFLQCVLWLFKVGVCVFLWDFLIMQLLWCLGYKWVFSFCG